MASEENRSSNIVLEAASAAPTLKGKKSDHSPWAVEILCLEWVEELGGKQRFCGGSRTIDCVTPLPTSGIPRGFNDPDKYYCLNKRKRFDESRPQNRREK